MNFLNPQSYKGDLNLWMKPCVKADRSEYWEYVLFCYDDILGISDHGEEKCCYEIGKPSE